ncbi:MAG: hypothetical protein ACKPA9_09195, partial [Microcystis sp.]
VHSYNFTILEILLIIAVSMITWLFSFLYSLTSLQGIPLQRTSRGSSFCVTDQGREGYPPLSRANVEPWYQRRKM